MKNHEKWNVLMVRPDFLISGLNWTKHRFKLFVRPKKMKFWNFQQILSWWAFLIKEITMSKTMSHVNKLPVYENQWNIYTNIEQL